MNGLVRWLVGTVQLGYAVVLTLALVVVSDRSGALDALVTVLAMGLWAGAWLLLVEPWRLERQRRRRGW